MVVVAISAMVISRLITGTLLISDDDAAVGRFLPIIWVNFLIELIMMIAGVYFVYRIVLKDRRVRKQQDRIENLADIAVMSGGLVHEARNHIHAMKPHLALIRKRASDPEKVKTRVAKVESVADDLEKLLSDFLIFARPADDNAENVDLVELAREVIELKRPALRPNKITANLEHEADLPALWIDRLKFRSVLLNLILNAAQAIEKEGNIQVRMSRQRNRLFLRVEDDGCGIADQDRQKIFQSFFTTRGEGTGLGLAIVQRTIQDIGGTISVTSKVGQGTKFTIELPIKRNQRPQ